MENFEHLQSLVDLDEEREILHSKLRESVKKCNRKMRADFEAVQNGTDAERVRFYQFSRMYVAITESYEEDEAFAYDSYNFEQMKSLHRRKLGKLYALIRHYRDNGQI